MLHEAQASEIQRDSDVLRAKERAIHRKSLSIVLLRAVEIPFQPQHVREIPETLGDVGVWLAEHLPVERQRFPDERLRLVEPAQLKREQASEIVQAHRDGRMRVAERLALHGQAHGAEAAPPRHTARDAAGAARGSAATARSADGPRPDAAREAPVRRDTRAPLRCRVPARSARARGCSGSPPPPRDRDRGSRAGSRPTSRKSGSATSRAPRS